MEVFRKIESQRLSVMNSEALIYRYFNRKKESTSKETCLSQCTMICEAHFYSHNYSLYIYKYVCVPRSVCVWSIAPAEHIKTHKNQILQKWKILRSKTLKYKRALWVDSSLPRALFMLLLPRLHKKSSFLHVFVKPLEGKFHHWKRYFPIMLQTRADIFSLLNTQLSFHFIRNL